MNLWTPNGETWCSDGPLEMINGGFDPFGRPYVRGRLALPRLQVDNYVDLLVDTGADCTTLHPRDGILMDTPYGQLIPGAPITGMGGIASSYDEPAVVLFQDGPFIRVYSIILSIPEPGPHNDRLPSLLGQDVLQSWRMVHDKPGDRLTFTVKHADLGMRGDIDSVRFNA